MIRSRIHKILSILLAMALCLGMLPTAALAAGENTVNYQFDNNTLTARTYNITCSQDTIIDLTNVTDGTNGNSARFYIETKNEGVTVTLRGDGSISFPVDVTFAAINNILPEKVVLENFCTSKDIEAYNPTEIPLEMEMEYIGRVCANRIDGGRRYKDLKNFNLTLTAAEGAVLNTKYLYENHKLALNGGTISGLTQIYVEDELMMENCTLTMADGDRTIHANNVVVDGSTLGNVKEIYAVYTGLIYKDEDGNMYNSSIEIKNGSILELTGEIYNAKEITIESSTVNYTGSPDNILRLGGLFLTLNIRNSTVTGATVSDDSYPAIGLDPWSWNNWKGKGNNQIPAITIDNSTVFATGGQFGPAIGRGCWSVYDIYPAMTINIQSGSNVTAIAQQGAGIGSGAILSNKTVGALDITITDSTVRSSGVSGAGIGSGFSKVDIDVPTNVSIFGNSDITAASAFGAGIGAGQKGSNLPSGGTPLEFGGSGGWDNGGDQNGTAGLQSLSFSALAASSRSAAAGLAENTGTLTISSNSNGDTPIIRAESGVKAVSLKVSADTPMMEYTLADGEDAPDVTTPINRVAAGSGTDNGPGAPSYDLRPGFRSLAFWPVAADSYTLSYGSGSDPDPLLDVDNNDSSTYMLTAPASGGDALAAYTVVRQRKLGGSVTLSASGSENTDDGVVIQGTSLTTVLTTLTPSGIQTTNVTYQWYKDGTAIEAATAASYTPTEAGVYFCAVTGTGLYRGTVNSQSVTVATTPGSVPDAPTVTNPNTQITAGSITLDRVGDNYQYSIDGGKTWQDSTIFDNLTRNTEYSFVQRVGESGAVSAAAFFITKPGKPSEADLQINYESETYTMTTGVSAYTDDNCKNKITVDVNAKITGYIGTTVYLKYDDVTEVNDTTVTAVSIKDRPAAPVLTEGMVSAAQDSLSLKSVSGVTYALFNTADTETPLQTINGDGGTITFESLNSSTTYVLKARKEATITDFHSYQARLEVSTSAILTAIGVTPGENSYPYDGGGHAFVFTTTPSNIDKDGFTVKYYNAETEAFTEAKNNAPTEIGTYSVIVTREVDSTYAEYKQTFERALTITKGVANVEQNVSVMRGTDTQTVQINTIDSSYGDVTGYALGTITSEDRGNLNTDPSVSDSGLLSYQLSASTAAGAEFSIPVIVSTEKYDVTVTVKIKVTDKEEAVVTVTQANGLCNTELADPVITVKDGNGNDLNGQYQVQYSGTGSTSYGPSTAKPTQPGSYIVTVIYADDTHYGTGAANFIITAPSYSISASPGTLNFGSETVGYQAAPAVQTVTVTNTGNQSVTVTLPASTNYTVTAGTEFTNNIADLVPGDTATFTITPQIGLAAGNYDETLTISDSNGASASVRLSFAVTEAAHTHQGKYISGKGATCTEEGSKEYYSCDCGRFFEDESCTTEITDLDTWKVISKLEHTWPGDYVKEHADAEKHYHICTVCGTKNEGEAHTWNVEAATEETDKHCTVCGYVAETQVGHVHGGMHVDGKDASCTEEGSREYYNCSCGKFFEDESCTKEIADLDDWKVIPKLSHTWSADYQKEHADAEKHYHVCTVCGTKNEGEAHIWNVEAATEETDKHCTVCGYVAEEKLEPVHTHQGRYVAGKDATCTEDGSKEYYSCSCGRFFEDESCTREIMDLDSWKVIAKLSHTWSADYLKEHADAEKHYHICTVCGTKDEGEAHTWNVEAATEKTDRHCTVCGYVAEEKLEPVHNHQGKHISGKAATCTDEGNNEYWYCETCGKYFRDKELTQEITEKETVIEAKGHGKTELKNKKEATYTAEGYTGDTVCKDCGEVLEKGETIPKLARGHKDRTHTSRDDSDSDYKTADPAGSGGQSDNAGKGIHSAQTNDDSNLVLWIFLMLAAGAALAGTAVYVHKKKRGR